MPKFLALFLATLLALGNAFAVSAHALAISACLYSKAEFANTSAPHDSVNSTGAQPEAGR